MQILKYKSASKLLKGQTMTQLFALLGILLAVPITVSAQEKLVSGITFSVTSDAISSPEQIPGRKAVWQKSLSTIAKTENVALFFDIDLNKLPPQVTHDEPRGTLVMQTLAGVTDRTWKQVKGIQTFSRNGNNSLFEDRYADNLVRILNWIKSLNPDQREPLFSGWFKLDQTPPDIQGSFIDLSSCLMPDTSFAFLNKDTRFGFSLLFEPRISYIDFKSGHRYFVSLASTWDLPDMMKPVFEIPLLSPVETLEKPGVGPLDFGNGKVLSAQELLEKAAAIFKKRYVIDGRIAQSYYFVSGQFSQQAFESAMQNVLAVAPVRISSPQENPQEKNLDQTAARALFENLRQNEWKDLDNQQVDITWLRRRNLMRNIAIGARDGAEIRRRQEVGETQLEDLTKKYGATEQLPLNEFFEHKKTTMEEISAGHPGLAAELAHAGLTPSTKITLEPGMALKLEVDSKQNDVFVLQLLSN